MPKERSTSIDVSTLFSLKGKTALVTGGSRGIGRMIAEGFLQAGATVYISSRKADVCEKVATDLSAQGGTCHALPADIARDNDEHGFRKVLELNVTALFFLTRDLTPLLARAADPDDPARVINIGSMDGVKAPTVLDNGTFPYSASKAAVHHLTRTLALELAPQHITVNAVAPGFFESKMTAESLELFRDAIEHNCPLGRIGHPEDMAGIAIYLASRAGAYINGTVIPVDGGSSIT